MIKLSESSEKTTLPGELDAIRFMDRNGMWAGDTIIPKDLDIGQDRLSRDINSVNLRNGRILPFPSGARFVRLLKPWMRSGNMVQEAYQNRDAAAILEEARATHKETMARLDPSHQALPPNMPKRYGVGAAEELIDKKNHEIARARTRGSMERQRARLLDLVA